MVDFTLSDEVPTKGSDLHNYIIGLKDFIKAVGEEQAQAAGPVVNASVYDWPRTESVAAGEQVSATYYIEIPAGVVPVARLSRQTAGDFGVLRCWAYVTGTQGTESIVSVVLENNAQDVGSLKDVSPATTQILLGLADLG